MIKTKWLDARLPCDLSEFAQKMQGHSYKRGEQSGLDLLDLQKDRLSGRFTQEVIQKEVLKDPFGEEFTVESKRYVIFDFTFVNAGRDRHLLRLDGPPRTVKPFFEKLYAVVGFGLFISPIEINVPAFIKSAKHTAGINQLRVTRVRASGLALDGRATAKVEMLSQSDALVDLDQAFHIKKTQIEKACISFIFDHFFRNMEVTQMGVIAVEEEMVDAVTEIFTAFFRASIQ